MGNAVVTLDGNAPVGLVKVSDVLDNQFWKFCEDDIDAKVPTYDQLGLHPDALIPAGTTVRIDHLWFWLSEGGLSAPTDYVVTLPKDASLQKVVHFLLSHYHTAAGEVNGNARFYYVEGVGKNAADEYVIYFGT